MSPLLQDLSEPEVSYCMWNNSVEVTQTHSHIQAIVRGFLKGKNSKNHFGIWDVISTHHRLFLLHSSPETQAGTVLSLLKGHFSTYELSSPVCQEPSSVNVSLYILCFPPSVFTWFPLQKLESGSVLHYVRKENLQQHWVPSTLISFVHLLCAAQEQVTPPRVPQLPAPLRFCRWLQVKHTETCSGWHTYARVPQTSFVMDRPFPILPFSLHKRENVTRTVKFPGCSLLFKEYLIQLLASETWTARDEYLPVLFLKVSQEMKC